MLKTFPAKVLLLGEYTILSGSQALALPYDSLLGKWSFEDTHTLARENSIKSLNHFFKKSQATCLDMDRLGVDLKNGLWFDSTIPQGFGLGSSGAVIAALYDRYGKKGPELDHDKKELARLEDFFHGSSSGLDPLVSHIQRPLLIHSPSEVEVLKQTPHLNGFFLINTGKPRQTGPLVTIYQDKMKDPEFKRGCAEILGRDVNFAIDAVLKNEPSKIFHHLWHISKFQWDFFPEMIPTKERSIWTRGLETGDYALKLCGAGGGGYILGYSNKLTGEQMRHKLSTHELKELK